MTWEQAWQTQRTGWDQGEAVPSLIDHLNAHRGDGAQRALVPGCGSGYDVFALAERGYIATGLDLAATAAKRFEMLREQRGLTQRIAHIELGDFFTFTPAQPFDLVWDYTFLCAIEPSMRPQWGEAMARLIRPGGTLLTLLFPVREPSNPAPVTDDDQGPPYRLHLAHARHVLQAHFELVSCAPPERSHPGRAELEQLAQWTRKQGD
jgi:SAM-dependent methyltransferase